MKWLSGAIDWMAESFGGLPFIAIYNVVTMAWVCAGIFLPHFPDPYPSNFYTLTVSWLAINMSSLLLWNERRKMIRARRADAAKEQAEQANEKHKMETLQAILQLAEAEADHGPLIRKIAENQMMILEQMRLTEAANARRAAKKRGE